jgi:O-antigen/teichoic acid export membrane protein
MAFDVSLMVILLFLSFSVNIALSPFGIGLHVKEKFVLHNVIRLTGEIARIITLLVLLFFVSTKVLWVVVATSFGSIVTLLIRILFSRRSLPFLKFRPSYFSLKLARELLTFGSWNSVHAAAMALKYNTDVLILNRLSSPLNVTCSYLGRLFQKQANAGWEFVRVSLNPSLTALHTLGRESSLKSAYLRGGRYALWFTLFFAVPLIIFSEEIIVLYVGHDYLPAALVMTILMLTTPFEYGNVMIVGIARARGDMKTVALCTLLAQIINMILTILVVYHTGMGAIGAAAATAFVTVFFEPLMMWPLGFRLANVTLNEFLEKTLKPGLIPSVMTAIVLVSLKIFFLPYSWLSLFLCASTGGVVYGCVLYAFCFQPVDKRDIEAIVKQFKQRFCIASGT